MPRITVAALALLIATTANAGNVERFYHSSLNPTPNPNWSSPLPLVGPPVLEASSGDVNQDIVGSLAEGHAVLGYSAFNGPASSDREVLNLAKKLGAQYVIRVSKYSNSVAGPSFGTSTFTRFGAFSLFAPTTINRFDQVDIFFVDTTRKGIGLYGRSLKPSEATELGTNKGVLVMAARRGSPAFNSDVLPGDVIASVNGSAVYDGDTFKAAVIAAYGSNASLTILRKGQTVTKQVPLSKDGTW